MVDLTQRLYKITTFILADRTLESTHTPAVVERVAACERLRVVEARNARVNGRARRRVNVGMDRTKRTLGVPDRVLVLSRATSFARRAVCARLHARGVANFALAVVVRGAAGRRLCVAEAIPTLCLQHERCVRRVCVVRTIRAQCRPVGWFELAGHTRLTGCAVGAGETTVALAVGDIPTLGRSGRVKRTRVALRETFARISTRTHETRFHACRLRDDRELAPRALRARVHVEDAVVRSCRARQTRRVLQAKILRVESFETVTVCARRATRPGRCVRVTCQTSARQRCRERGRVRPISTLCARLRPVARFVLARIARQACCAVEPVGVGVAGLALAAGDCRAARGRHRERRRTRETARHTDLRGGGLVRVFATARTRRGACGVFVLADLAGGTRATVRAVVPEVAQTLRRQGAAGL